MSELSRLRWLCRRGMKELDLVLNRYLDQYYETAPSDEQRQFESLLQMADPDLYHLLLGRSEITDPEIARLTQFLRDMPG